MKSVIYLLKEFEGDEWDFEYVVKGFTFNEDTANKWVSIAPHIREREEIKEISSNVI